MFLTDLGDCPIRPCINGNLLRPRTFAAFKLFAEEPRTHAQVSYLRSHLSRRRKKYPNSEDREFPCLVRHLSVDSLMAEKDNSMREREEEDEERSFQDEESRRPPEEEPPQQNEAMEEQRQVFPLPGWTERGHQVEQCTDLGGPYCPIWGVAVHTTSGASHNARTSQPQEVIPLPGWTEKGHQVQQCTDQGLPGSPHCPIWGIAVHTSSIGLQYHREPDPQEHDCLCASCRSDHC